MIDFVALENRKAFLASLMLAEASETGAGPNSGVGRAESGATVNTSRSTPLLKHRRPRTSSHTRDLHGGQHALTKLRIAPVSSTRHFCTDCTAMVVVTSIGGKKWVDPIEGAYCHGDLFCHACLSSVITGQRLCRGCAC